MAASPSGRAPTPVAASHGYRTDHDPALEFVTLRIGSLVIVAASLLALVAGLSLWHDKRDPRLGAEATAMALQKELHKPYGFSCTPEENDRTLELDDVDYACQADQVSEPGYWVGTDGSKITGTQSMG